MKHLPPSRLLVCLLLVAAGPAVRAGGSCDAGADPGAETCSVSWTDRFGETTYALTAPCKVLVDAPFTVSARVVDSRYPGAAVGWKWAVSVKPPHGGRVTLAEGGEDWIWLDADGQWSRASTLTPSGPPGDHVIEFSFVDFGHGPGGHSLRGSVIGEVTVSRP